MKKIYNILSAAILIALAASCAKDEKFISDAGHLQKHSITATSESGRTSLDASNGVIWTAGDAISVLYGTSNKQFTTTAGGSSATFEGEADFQDGDDVFAVYPYSTGNKIEDGKLLVTIPAVQAGVPDSFADGINATVGKVVDGKVSMKNVGGLVKLPIAGSDITSVTLRATDIVPLSGSFLADCSGDTPVLTAYKTSNAVKLVPTTGKTTFEPGTYYIAVAGVEMANGFELVYTKAAARGVKTTTNSCTIQRSHILPIAAQDAAISFTTGRFIEISFVDDDNNISQPFTEDLIVKSSKPDTPNTGVYYLDCPEEYMFRLTGLDGSGYYLNTKTGWNYLDYLLPSDSTNYPNVALPAFAHKALSHFEFYTALGGDAVDPYSLDNVKNYLNTKVAADVKFQEEGSSSWICRRYSKDNSSLTFNGTWWASGNYYTGGAFFEFDLTEPKQNTAYVFQNARIKKLVLFYAGEDVEEVTSVKAEIPASIGSEQTGQVSGSFKSWNYGEGGATYAAGIDYKLANDKTWTTVSGEVTGQTFTAEIPSGLSTGSYVCRAWAGVDGVDGAKIYGPEKAFTVSGGSVETKTLSYNFLQGDSKDWTTETAAQWPFDADSNPGTSNESPHKGKTINITDDDGNALVAHYENFATTGKARIQIFKGYGWRVRNANDAETKKGYFQLDLPKFEKMRLTSVTVTTFLSSCDFLGIIDNEGNEVEGGEKASPVPSATWTLTGTTVNTVYSIRSFYHLSSKGVETPSGLFFEPTSITLKYESVSE